MKCVYCQKEKASSREHVISETVLKIVFGDVVRNTTTSSVFNNKTLTDYQHKILDVCSDCNSSLSPYDVAGGKLVSDINKFYDASFAKIKIDSIKLGWLIKTHLNLIRLSPDKRTGLHFQICQDIYTSLIKKSQIDTPLYVLAIDGYQGKEYFWDENDSKHIQYFSHKSVTFPDQEILVSNFRIKSIDTFLLLPTNNDYDNFANRCKSVRVDMKNGYDINPSEVDIKQTLTDGYYLVTNIVPFDRILRSIEEVKKA